MSLSSSISKPMTMPTINHNEPAMVSFDSLINHEVIFPAGLLGFPESRRYKLKRFNSGDGSESPFLLLSSLDQDLSFLLIHPDCVTKDYCISVSPEILRSLQTDSEPDLLSFLIVTLRDRIDDITVNLQGPLLINVVSRLAAQLVLEDYPVRHPLVAAPNGQV
jgi:flagellar assembly factor FliW